MKGDIGSNFTIAEGLTALSRTADTYYTAAVDHADAPCASFFLSCGTYAGTDIVATVQWSDTLGSGYIDEAGSVGNDISGTITAEGSIQLDVPNPRGRYSRVKIVHDGTCVYSVTSILGPLRRSA